MDLELSKTEFLNYTSGYDLNNFHIKRKVDHSLRVMALCKNIAEYLELSKEEIDLAALIGLLHDIGRFEQMTIYNTFNDRESIDHGELGTKILKENNYIRNYIKEDKYDNIIFTAISNHNKLKIEDGLAEKELLFSKIIRDADKIDILYQGTCITWANSEEEVEKEKIHRKDIQPIIEQRIINRSKDLLNCPKRIKHILTVLGFAFDINFNQTYKILKQQNYINKIIDRFDFKDEETNETIEEARRIVNAYIDSKQKG